MYAHGCVRFPLFGIPYTSEEIMGGKGKGRGGRGLCEGGRGTACGESGEGGGGGGGVWGGILTVCGPELEATNIYF